MTTPAPASPVPTGSEPVHTGFNNGRIGAHVTTPVIADHPYLTPQLEWGDVERGNPLPYTLPPDRRRQIGMERETWQLEVVADADSDAEIDAPLSINFEQLLEIGQQHGVRILKGVTCNNLGDPLGMGLWEGVPLRVLIWMTRPVRNIRRVFYYGHHNEDPVQMFRSSLPLGRVLEEPPGELPVLVAYRLNGELLSGKRGGPVRMVVPEAYGFKSVKWLKRVVLTNWYAANDTYENGNNDVDSAMKTFARFASVPTSVAAGAPLELNGIAQVGVSGLGRVEYWVRSTADASFDAERDPYCATGDWQLADLQQAPADLASLGLTTRVQREEWPLRYTFVRWRATVRGLAPGQFELRCRSVDLNGIAQPMPRPFPKSGRAEIQKVLLTVV